MKDTSGRTLQNAFAFYDPDGHCLKTSQATFLSDLMSCSPTLPQSGSMRNGALFERPMLEPPISVDACTSWLPTPTATPYGSNQSPSPNAAVRPGLEALVKVLPTPTATDAKNSRNSTANRRPGAKFNSGDTLLDAVTKLLPTPTASDGKGGPGHPSTKQGGAEPQNGTCRDEWGPYDAAIRRWEIVNGPAPPPTDVNGRLNADLTDWMMGFPPGWTVIRGVSRPKRLKMGGNAVVPAQAIHAFTGLMGRLTKDINSPQLCYK